MEYCGVELTDEGLKHYGVKGMHWGVRRYQPYPGQADGRQLSKRQVRKTVRAIKKNSKRYAQRKWYAEKSMGKAFELKRLSDKAKKQGDILNAKKLDEKANKQIKDSAEHTKGMADYKKNITSAIKKIESTGKYDVYSKKGRTFLSGSGRMFTAGAAAGILGIGTVGMYRALTGRTSNGKIYYDKPVLKKTNGVYDPNNKTNTLKDPVIRFSAKSKERLVRENEPLVKNMYDTNPGYKKYYDHFDPLANTGHFVLDTSKLKETNIIRKKKKR